MTASRPDLLMDNNWTFSDTETKDLKSCNWSESKSDRQKGKRKKTVPKV